MKPIPDPAASKNDLASTIYNILLQTHGDGMATENLHQIRDRIVEATLEHVKYLEGELAAAREQNDEQRKSINRLIDAAKTTAAARDAAREQHGAMERALRRQFESHQSLSILLKSGASTQGMISAIQQCDKYAAEARAALATPTVCEECEPLCPECDGQPTPDAGEK